MSAAKSFADILESYRPSSETVSVELPCGSVMVFKTLGRLADTQQMYEAGAKWYLALTEMEEDGLAAIGMAGLVPKSIDEAAVAYLVASLAVDPPVSHREACQMVAYCGELARFLMARIEADSRTMGAVRLARMTDEAKKNSAATGASGSGSSSGSAGVTSQDGSPDS